MIYMCMYMYMYTYVYVNIYIQAYNCIYINIQFRNFSLRFDSYSCFNCIDHLFFLRYRHSYAITYVNTLKRSILCPFLSHWDCPSPSTGVTDSPPPPPVPCFYVVLGSKFMSLFHETRILLTGPFFLPKDTLPLHWAVSPGLCTCQVF